MRYSLAKIADELGLSKATISMVLNGKAQQGRIGKEVEERVLEFCRKVNYVPNIHAQLINKKYVNTFGFLVNQGVLADSDNPFSDLNITSILGGIVLAAEKIDYRISIQLYNNEMNEEKVFEWLRNREIDGLIYYGLNIPEKWREIFSNEKRSVVGIGIEPDKDISSVNIDNFTMSANITKHLIENGRKKFMYISGIDGSFVSDERKRGCISALNESGIGILPQNIISAKYSEKEAQNLILKLKPNVDAIVCANDDMAIGVIKALKKLNINIPKEIAVVGGDNICTSGYVSPSLTTYENNQHQLGMEAVNVIHSMINGGSVKAVTLPSDLIIRESSN
ncbi:MAG: LacI family transcriptional regulator [Ruminococcaceae bacterium]|nr:LacI family transcriptional regulator [Oscillospiraceae bacterium]